MCCIGQFSIQLGAKDSEILDKAYLCYVNEPVPPFTKLSKFGGHEDSELASDCIIINDDPETTPEVKIKLLTERLAKEGVVLKVINKPH